MKIGWTKFEKYDKATFPPNEEEQYLITTTAGRLDFATWTNIYFFGHAVEGDWHWETPVYVSVLAWMPLPIPFVDNEVKEDEQ